MAVEAVSEASEARMRAAFAGEDTLDGDALVRRYRRAPPRAVPTGTAKQAISNANRCGLLLRFGPPGHPQYVLNPYWHRPETRPYFAGPATKRRPTTATGNYAANAVCAGPLVPSLGTRCNPEVMPLEVGKIVDSLHQRFYRHATGVE